MMVIKKLGLFRTLFLLSAVSVVVSLQAREEKWYSHQEVAHKVRDTFEKMDSYRASFEIETGDGRNTRRLAGTVYYSKPGKLRFAFSKPYRDLIVSDGKILWIYMNRLHAVGKQDLTLKSKDENGREIFLSKPGDGLSRLFSKYHYRFDTAEQPRKDEDGTFFVFDLEQREKIGGYERIKLFVDSETYLIKKAIATDGFGRVTSIKFSSQKVNPPLEGKLFQFHPDDSMRVVFNPLVND